MNEQQLRACGALPDTCSERVSRVCLMCGTAGGSAEAWRRGGNCCAVCENETYRDECARCHGECAGPSGAGGRRCVALNVYRASGRVAFPERLTGDTRKPPDRRPDTKKPPDPKKPDPPPRVWPQVLAAVGGFISATWTQYKRSMYRFAVFEGRSNRTELLSFVAWQVFGFVAAEQLGWGPYFVSATVVPTLAIAVRRLHDIGRTGKWLLILLAWPIAMVVLPCMLLWSGTSGRNSFGEPSV